MTSWVKYIARATVLAIFAIISTHAAIAGPNQGPDQADVTRYDCPSGARGCDYLSRTSNADYTVSTSTYVTIIKTTLHIYTTSPTATIRVIDADQCTNDARGLDGRNYDAYFGAIQPTGKLATNYIIKRLDSNGNVIAVPKVMDADGVWNQGTGSVCWSKEISVNATNAMRVSNYNLYGYELTADTTGAPGLFTNNFHIQVDVPAGEKAYVSPESNAYYGLSPTSPIPAGINDQNANPRSPHKVYFNINQRFAPDCTLTTPTATQSIRIYDDDNLGNYDVQPRPFYVFLTAYRRSDGALIGRVPLVRSAASNPGTNLQNIGSSVYWPYTTPPGTNNLMTIINFTVNRSYVYILTTQALYYDNTLMISIPYESVNYYVPCVVSTWDLSGATSGPGSVVAVGETAQWTHSVTNIGTSATNANVTAQVHQTIDGVDSLVDAPINIPSGIASSALATTQTKTYITTSADIGKIICQYISWSPDTQAGGSGSTTPVCFVVAKVPQVQIWGGDVRVGNSFLGSAGNVSTKASISTASASVVSGRLYGSWGEYGMLSPALGTVNSASGGVLSGSTGGISTLSAAQQNVLTFANTSPPYGRWGTPGKFPSIVTSAAFAGGGTSPAAVINIGARSGIINLTHAGTVRVSGTLDAGTKKLVLKSTGDIEIDGDILYGNASFSSAADVQQLIIIAKNIRINPNVSVVNAWLIAQPSGGSGGVISTCGSPSTPDYFTGLRLGDACEARQLKINGIVMATELQLRRTHGADTLNGPAKSSEIINMRPDAYLWAQAQSSASGQIDTIMTTELSPRF